MCREYIRQDELELDIQALFTMAGVTDKLKPIDRVENRLKQMQQMLSSDEPDIDIGKHCSSPYECNFKAHCWQHIPQPSVFNLSRIGKKGFDYYNQGKITIRMCNQMI